MKKTAICSTRNEDQINPIFPKAILGLRENTYPINLQPAMKLRA
jgi:hypothetical protein